MNTLKEYVDNKFTLVPAKPLMAAAIFTTKATTHYPTLTTVRVFRNKDGMCEMWATDTYRAVRVYWPDKVNDPDFDYDFLVDVHELKSKKILNAKPTDDDWLALMPFDNWLQATMVNSKATPVVEGGSANLSTHAYDKFPNLNLLFGIIDDDRVRSVPTLNAKYVADVFKCADAALGSKSGVVTVEMIPGDSYMKPVMFSATNPNRRDAGVEALVMPIRK